MKTLQVRVDRASFVRVWSSQRSKFFCGFHKKGLHEPTRELFPSRCIRWYVGLADLSIAMKPSSKRPRVLLVLLLVTMQVQFSRADVGTAAHYSPPYTPTACFGNDPSQFPSSNLFAAAGEGIWDNGASCGRQYLVRCISASVSGTCIPSQTIQVRIVDRALSSSSRPSSSGATIVLSTTAFGTIAKSSAAAVNVEYQQV
ncbi:EG45-like domain containing protein [Eucalyptus grandis]|uniref:EG45-like domain containing protein n=1 Tax=Eucalyptus grandis TaxID=71139 RepID=UPI0008A0D0AC|nr:EG45-like domain containing protein [Eucalyptus grandis]